MFNFVRCALIAATAWALVSTASAQRSYPDKPVHLIIAFVPGGATDTFARQIAPDLQEALGQPVVIENKPGAGGYIAWNHVASSNPDGYTLLLAENAVAISQALYKKSKSSFDPLTQYDAIAGLAAAPSALVLANNVPAKTVAELVAHSKSVPQKLNFASAGIGSVSHLNFEVFMDKTGMQAVHVPYKGGGQAIGDVIAGHVPMTITSVQGTKGLVESGKVKALAVTQHGPLAGDAQRPHHAGGRGARGRRGAALLVCGVRAEGLARAGEGQAVASHRESDGKRRGARAPRQARHHAGRDRWPGDERQARTRDQELDAVHRRQGHQGRVVHRRRSAASAGTHRGACPYRRTVPAVVE
jgi:tripartite-type tricarboxylate transporter receptor subunit TctC